MAGWRGWRVWVAAAAVLVVAGGVVVLVVVRSRVDKPAASLVRRYLVRSVAYSPDGRTLAVGEDDGHDGQLSLWDVSGRRQIAVLAREGAVGGVAFSPDGRTLAAGVEPLLGRGGVVELWDVATRRQVGTAGTTAGPLYAVAFSCDGHTIAVGGAEGTALWDLRTRRGSDLASAGFDAGTAAAFSPDGRLLAVGRTNGSAGDVQLWDVATRRLLHTFSSDNHAATAAVAFSPDGRTVAAGSGSGGLNIYDIPTATRRAALAREADLGERGIPVAAVAFSPDGRSLATGSTDGHTRLWDLATGRAVTPPGARTRACSPSRSAPTGARWPPAAPTTPSGSGRSHPADLPYAGQGRAVRTGSMQQHPWVRDNGQPRPQGIVLHDGRARLAAAGAPAADRRRPILQPDIVILRCVGPRHGVLSWIRACQSASEATQKTITSG